ncbi:MAG: hypothetical protein QM811_11775 [Pirellulales bacterium]
MFRLKQSARRLLRGTTLCGAIVCLGCDDAVDPPETGFVEAQTPALVEAAPTELASQPHQSPEDVPTGPSLDPTVAPNGLSAPNMLPDLAAVPESAPPTAEYGDWNTQRRFEPTLAPDPGEARYPLNRSPKPDPVATLPNESVERQPQARISNAPRLVDDTAEQENTQKQKSSIELSPEFIAAFAPRPDLSAVGVGDIRGPAVRAANGAGTEIAAAAHRAQRGFAAPRTWSSGRGLRRTTRIAVGVEGLGRGAESTARVRRLRPCMLAGLAALEEAQDFVADSPAVALSVRDRAAGHRTTVLHGQPLNEMTPLEALEHYMAYAHRQLTIAGGDLLPAADAYYALGKLHMLSISSDSGQARLETLRTTTLFQAAMVIEPKHALAANELGVLFARVGRLDDAKSALRHSASLAAHPSTWRRSGGRASPLERNEIRRTGRAGIRPGERALATKFARNRASGRWHDSSRRSANVGQVGAGQHLRTATHAIANGCGPAFGRATATDPAGGPCDSTHAESVRSIESRGRATLTVRFRIDRLWLRSFPSYANACFRRRSDAARRSGSACASRWRCRRQLLITPRP